MPLRRTLLRITFLLSAVVLLAQGGDSAPSRREPAERPRREGRSASQKPAAAGERAAAASSSLDAGRRRAARLDATLAALEQQQQEIAQETRTIRARRDSVEQQRTRLVAEYALVARALLKQQLMTPRPSILLLPGEHRRLALKKRVFERYAERQRERAGQIGVSGRFLARQDSILREREIRQAALVAAKRAEIVALLDQQGSDSSTHGETEALRRRLNNLIDRKKEDTVRSVPPNRRPAAPAHR